MCLSVGTGRKTARSFLIRRPLIALPLPALPCSNQRWADAANKFRKSQNPQTGGLTKFDRLTDLPKMRQLKHFQFGDQFLNCDFRIRFFADWKLLQSCDLRISNGSLRTTIGNCLNFVHVLWDIHKRTGTDIGRHTLETMVIIDKGIAFILQRNTFIYEPERPFMHLTDCCWFLISPECVSVMGGWVGSAVRKHFCPVKFCSPPTWPPRFSPSDSQPSPPPEVGKSRPSIKRPR